MLANLNARCISDVRPFLHRDGAACHSSSFYSQLPGYCAARGQIK